MRQSPDPVLKARRAFEAVVRDSERLQRRLRKLFPSAWDKSGNDDPAPETMIGLSQAAVYASKALSMSDFGMEDMLKRHAFSVSPDNGE